jgi:hypothetical protein
LVWPAFSLFLSVTFSPTLLGKALSHMASSSAAAM